MKLNSEQKEALINWIAEGMQFKEINDKGETFDPPFGITVGQFKYYRSYYKDEILDLQETNGRDLTPRQLLFSEYYIQTLNGTLSSKLAGYAGDNDNIHAVNASKLLRLTKIRKFLSKRYSDVAMNTDEVLALLAKLARASLSDYVNDHGIIDWAKVEKDGYSIGGVTHTKGQQSKIILESRLRALELIGKAHAMFTMKIAPTDPTGTKEYGSDIRDTLRSLLLQETTLEGKGTDPGEADQG